MLPGANAALPYGHHHHRSPARGHHLKPTTTRPPPPPVVRRKPQFPKFANPNRTRHSFEPPPKRAADHRPPVDPPNRPPPHIHRPQRLAGTLEAQIQTLIVEFANVLQLFVHQPTTPKVANWHFACKLNVVVPSILIEWAETLLSVLCSHRRLLSPENASARPLRASCRP